MFQVLDLAYLDLLIAFLLERLYGRGIGAALVHPELFRQAVLPDCFLEKAQGSFLVAIGCG